MTRPSRNTDQLLLSAGKKLMLQHGIAKLSLRQVASDARVNLGMFHYHFKTKEQFTRALLSEIYEEMFQRLSDEIKRHETTPDPLVRLKGLLSVLGGVAIENRSIWGALVKEVLSGEPTVARFVRENFPRHIRLVSEAIVDCQKKNRLRSDLTVAQIIALCASIINAPVVLGSLIGKFVQAENTVASEILTPEFLELRIDFLMRGLVP